MNERRGGALELRGLTKRFGSAVAVDDISLSIAAGEFVSFLGPSGSGKTTTLNMVAGFLRADAGAIHLDGREVTGVPAHERGLGMVFQSYALFPHMSALDNVAFPLRMRGRSKAESAADAREALASVHLAGFEQRLPRQLSGGQQQRVALARALVFRPPLLLMDEPLGALDKKLRDALQIEIVRVCREVGVTVVYVTHDQGEALSMSDRVAVYRAGRIEQIGSPEDLYERPASLFVAEFVGDSTTLRGHREGPDFVVAGHRVRLGERALSTADRLERRGRGLAAIVRPERVRLIDPSDATLSGTLEAVAYVGASRRCTVAVGDHLLVTATEVPGRGTPPRRRGARVGVAWDLDDTVVVADGPTEDPGDTQSARSHVTAHRRPLPTIEGDPA